ncbi:MAG: NAD(+)/NADH kinase [Alphaproteobacteria bacterium]
MPTVGLVLKRGAPGAREVARRVIDRLGARGTRAVAEPEEAGALGCEAVEKSAMFDVASAIVVLGGDGTYLATARLTGERRVPVLGVNLGGLGFLTEVGADDLAQALDEAVAGRAPIDSRAMLRAVVRRAGGGEEVGQALNDAVLSRGSLGRVIEIEARIDGRPLASFKGDGVIVATPTGSTAYALSAGGPIVHPSVRVFVLAPICPHTLSVRPLVIDDAARLELRLATRNEDMVLTLDGQQAVAVGGDDVVEIVRSPHEACLVRSPRLSFYDLLRTKLGWART